MHSKGDCESLMCGLWSFFRVGEAKFCANNVSFLSDAL
uniref:Uncharacterized protein n=1 Tax=Rhizophora mucronata TaxID=61149 RepID=A0A2P2IZ37_RHIMU